MEYPPQILPNPNYKLIDCDLSGHFVIRFINSNLLEEFWDSEVDRIRIEFICRQSDHIDDLSLSLLGIFSINHIYLDFTEEGKQKYMRYCDPDALVAPPVYPNDFAINQNRHYWWISIPQLNNVRFQYTRSNKPEVATCLVQHTPMLWNFWHFSLRWETEFGKLESLDARERRKAAQRIGHAARVTIAHYASIENPVYTTLEESCFNKN